MRTLLLAATLLFLYSCSQPAYLQADAVKLSTPTIEVEEYFFTKETTIEVGKTQMSSQVHYTTNGDSPTPKSPVAEGPLNIGESQTLKFRTIGGGFLPSEEATVEVVMLNANSLTLTNASPAAPPYNKVPETVLTNRAKAGKNFREENWLGYQDSLLTFEFSLPEGAINRVTLSVLEDQSSWIFAPAAVKATFYDEAGQKVTSGRMEYPAAVEKNGRHFRFLRVVVEEVQAASLRLEVENLGRIPEWHPGAGSREWVFLDEVFLD